MQNHEGSPGPQPACTEQFVLLIACSQDQKVAGPMPVSTLPWRCFQALRSSKARGEERLKAEDARPDVHTSIQICVKYSCTAELARQGANGEEGVVAVLPQLDSCLTLISTAPLQPQTGALST